MDEIQRNKGGRPKKKKIIIDDKKAFQDLLQEIYNESAEQRNKAIYSYNKQFKEATETNDIAMIGKITAEYLKIANEAIEKKMSVARLLKDIIYKDGAQASGKVASSTSLTEDDKNLIRDAIKGIESRTGVEYIIDETKDKKENKG